MNTKEKACLVATSADPKINDRTHYNVIRSIKKTPYCGNGSKGIDPAIYSFMAYSDERVS